MEMCNDMNNSYSFTMTTDCEKCRKLGGEHFHRLQMTLSSTSKTKMSLNTFQDMVSEFVDVIKEKRNEDMDWHCTVWGKFNGGTRTVWDRFHGARAVIRTGSADDCIRIIVSNTNMKYETTVGLYGWKEITALKKSILDGYNRNMRSRW